MKYTESHEWVRVKQQVGTVGITDHAQNELGDIVFVELPKVGQHLKAGQEVAVLESTKAAADIYTPVSGKIVKVNESLKETPSLINQSPQERGWIYEIELSHPKEFDMLLEEITYKAMLNLRP